MGRDQSLALSFFDIFVPFYISFIFVYYLSSSYVGTGLVGLGAELSWIDIEGVKRCIFILYN